MRIARRTLAALLALTIALAAIAPTVRAGSALSIRLITPDLASGGLDYQAGSDSLVVIVRPAAVDAPPMQMVTLDGTQFRFSRAPVLPADAPLVIAPDGGDFTEGEMYTTTGIRGQIAKLSDRAILLASAFARLPGESGVVTALAFSRGEPFGTDLIAATANGNLWRVSEGGRPAFLAAIGYPIRAVVPLPASERYGAAAGMLLIATGPPACRFYTVDQSGRASDLRLDIGCATDLDLIPPGSDLLFAGSFLESGSRVSGIAKVAAGALTTSACDVLVVHEKGPLSVLGWSVSGVHAIRAGTGDLMVRQAAFAGSAIRCQPELCGDGVDNNGDGEVDEDCPEPCTDDENCTEGHEHGEPEIGTPPAPVHVPRDTGCPPERGLAALSEWNVVTPSQPAGTVFSFESGPAVDAFAREPLAALLELEPGDSSARSDTRRLLRAGVAGLLNGAHAEVGYPLRPLAVAEHVSAALTSGNTKHAGVDRRARSV